MDKKYFFLLFFMLFFSAKIYAGYSYVTNHHQSLYCIYYSNHAPASVRIAAKELKLYIKKVTTVNIQVISGGNVPECKLISLGENAATLKYSINIDQVPLEGYRTVIRKNNIFILGHDTKDKQKTQFGGTSTGTLNGVYAFIEKYLGVRWLMPGEMGEFTPSITDLKISESDTIEGPAFLNRRIPYVQNKKTEVKEWLRRQKQGYSLQLDHGHSFARTISPDNFDKHPEWFPLIGGKRVPPVGRYKLETTNSDLVKAFSRQVVSDFNSNKILFSRSISPSDSGNWSESAESKKYYTKDPLGNLSVTPLVLDFYNNVAKQVYRKYPNKWVCGYIYSNYLFPPASGIPDLEKNLCLVIAPSFSYGYGLYRWKAKLEWERILQKWSGATDNIAYYDLPVMFFSDVAAPNPPGLEILSYIYPRLKAYNIKGVYIYGVSAWGHGGLTNYLLAKLNWNPDIDVYAEARSYLELSYGAEAGAIMYQLYMELDKATKQYHSKHRLARHNLNKKLLAGIYLPVIDRIGVMYNNALNSGMNAKQKSRLISFGNNMGLFYNYLAEINLIHKNTKHPFYMSDKSINKISKDAGKSFLYAPKKHLNIKKAYKNSGHKVKRLSKKLQDEVETQSPVLRGKSRVLLVSDKNTMVTIDIEIKRSFEELTGYSLYSAGGNVIATGETGEHKKISYHAQAGEIYYLDIINRASIYKLTIKNAEFSLSTAFQSRGLHIFKDMNPLYLYACNTSSDFSVTISADTPTEAAAVEIESPAGEVTILDTQGRRSDQAIFPMARNNCGFWLLSWKKSAAGRFEDVWLKVKGLSMADIYVKKDGLVIVDE